MAFEQSVQAAPQEGYSRHEFKPRYDNSFYQLLKAQLFAAD